MKRFEKLKLLEAIKQGKLKPEDLRPSKVYFITQSEYGMGKDWEYRKSDGTIQVMTDSDLEEFSKRVSESSYRREALGLEEDKIIILRYDDECEPIRE